MNVCVLVINMEGVIVLFVYWYCVGEMVDVVFVC